MKQWQRYLAELFGTFVLVFGGTTGIVAALKVVGGGPFGTGSGLGGVELVVPFAFGLALMAALYAFAEVSGGHFNPAVTLGFLVTRRIEPLLAGVYWVSQFLGALVAAALLTWLLPGSSVDATKLGVPQIAQIGAGEGLVIELILTFFLVWVIFATAADPRGTFRSIAGLAIGFTITLDIFIGGPYTGAAMNPARAFGPQLVHNAWANGWVWYLGPALGAVLAALAYEWLYLRPTEPEPVGPPETGVEEPGAGRTAAS